MTQALILSTLLLFTAGPTRSAASGAAAKLQAAQAEFNRGNFQASLDDLEEASRETNDDALLAKIYLLRGQAYGAMRDLVSAESALADALEHDPEATLDPNRVDPSLVTMLAGLKQRLKGTLDVTSDRPDAKVALDGSLLGTAPVHATVAIGRHKVVVRSGDGRFGASEEVVVRPRRTARVEAKLSELPHEQGDRGSDHGSDRGGEGSGAVLFGFGRPFGAIHLQIDPLQWVEGVGIAFGGGLQSRYVRAGVDLRIFPQFGITARGAFMVPVVDKFKAFIELEIPFIWYGDYAPFALGIGGEGGVEYEFNKWLALYAQVGARHFFISHGDADRLTVQGGIRLQLP